MKYIRVEYNQELKSLETVLSSVTQPGDFFVAGTLEIPMPRVEVKGAGVLSFPIPAAHIEKLVKQATQAPYGRGEATIVDVSVRNVWQIAPGAVKVGGKSWQASFAQVLSKVTAGLGCQDAGVSAELYKMLVYDRGGFFLAHRDTEKTAGMFGTLVVTLPALHHGGALRIRHRDREVTLESDATEPSEISFAAFYSDCEHEVLPVREGHRVCLVYNLIQGRMRKRIPMAPNYQPQVAAVATVLKNHWSSPRAASKIVWLLEHQYSPAGLAFSSLKGADAARARVLQQAAVQAECVVHLGVVHIEENGGAEWDGGFDYYGGGRSQYGDDEDEDEADEEGEDDDFTAISVDNSWQYLNEWRDTEDRIVQFGRIPLDVGELLPAGALDREPPDEKRLTEASGNEGATYERSYHRAALVLWPASRMMDVLLAGGSVSALPYLRQLAAGGKDARPQAIAAARRLVRRWPTEAQRGDAHSIAIGHPEPSDRAAMIALLVELNAKELLERFIRVVVVSAYDGSENAELRRSAKVLGDTRAAAVWSALFEARMGDRPGECVELLLALAANPAAPLRKVALAAIAGLDGVPIRNAEQDDTLWQLQTLTARLKAERSLAPEFVANFFSALARFKGRSLCEAAARKIAARPEVFPPATLVVPALDRMWSQQDQFPTTVERALERLWTSSAQFLLRRSEVPPQPPPDWRIEAKLSCTCADCLKLQAFIRDPAEESHRFRVNKERRRHLHQVIDRHRLEMTHVTHRAGSPQTLVCTKDRRTFQARMKEYQTEIAAMRMLMGLAPQTTIAGGLRERLRVAVEAGSIRDFRPQP